MALCTLSENWHCLRSYDGSRIRKDLKLPCSSSSWRIVEAVVWSVLMSSVGFQLGPQSLCLRADDVRTAVGSSPATPTARVALQLSRCEGSVSGRFDTGWQARFPPKLVRSVYQLQFTSCLS